MASRTVICTWLLVAILHASSGCRFAETQIGRPWSFSSMCQLSNPEIDESSGLVCSRKSKGVFWTHNDDAGDGRLFAVCANGEDLGVFPLVDAEIIDWEDLASFRVKGVDYLVIADVGDNLAMRDSLCLYIVEEPDVKSDSPNGSETIKPSGMIRFRFPNGPRNCEAVAVDPVTNAAILISKAKQGEACFVYSVPLSPSAETQIQAADYISTLSVPDVTSLAISSDGTQVAILAYEDVFELSRQTGESWQEVFSKKPLQVCRLPRGQYEAICYGRNNDALYVTREKLPTPILSITRQDTDDLSME